MAATKVVVGSANWHSKATKLIDKRKPFVLVVKGINAGAAWEALRNAVSREWAQRKLGARSLPKEPVSITLTIVICLAALTAVGLGVVAAVCVYGMHKGYKVRAKHRVTGPMIWDHTLDIALDPPN